MDMALHIKMSKMYNYIIMNWEPLVTANIRLVQFHYCFPFLKHYFYIINIIKHVNTLVERVERLPSNPNLPLCTIHDLCNLFSTVSCLVERKMK